MHFQSLVSTSSLRRRPSRLLSIATKKKTKTRILILTNSRLICAKIEKGGKVIAIRGEWPIPKVSMAKERINNEKSKPDKEKEKKKGKDSGNQAVISVEPKGENEFVVLTVRRTLLFGKSTDSPGVRQTTKSLSFIVEDSSLRSKWVSNIQRALDPTTTSTPTA